MLDKEQEYLDLRNLILTTVAHEFRTPLTVILSSTEILQQYINQLSDEHREKHLDRIQNTVHNLVKILDDILLLETDELQELEISSTRIEVVQFCIQLLKIIQRRNSGHTIYFNNRQQSILVNVDPKILQQILYNLLSNSIKYSPIGTNIYLNLFQEEKKVIFQVKYEGIGIPVTEQSPLLNSSQRILNVSHISDIDLGLSIVKKCVDLYQGKIKIENEIGIGTAITVMLPLDD